MRKVPTNNQHLFYQPKDVWVGDVMPFGKDGTFYLYHQRDTRDPAPLAEGQPFGWSLATTQDFVTYQEHGTAIPHGGEDDQDQFIYAGTVYEAKGEVRAFYTGFNRNYLREGKTSQVLMQAKACSDDYATWKKTGVAVELTPQPGYDGRNWRDPFVIWDDDRKEYLLVLGTRKGDDPSKPSKLAGSFTLRRRTSSTGSSRATSGPPASTPCSKCQTFLKLAIGGTWSTLSTATRTRSSTA